MSVFSESIIYCIFTGNIVLSAVSCLLGCLPIVRELSNDSAAIGFFAKITRFTKKFTRSQRNH